MKACIKVFKAEKPMFDKRATVVGELIATSISGVGSIYNIG